MDLCYKDRILLLTHAFILSFLLISLLLLFLPTAICAALYQSGALHDIQGVNVADLFTRVEAKVTELGPWGYVLFATIYIVAEVSTST